MKKLFFRAPVPKGKFWMATTAHVFNIFYLLCTLRGTGLSGDGYPQLKQYGRRGANGRICISAVENSRGSRAAHDDTWGPRQHSTATTRGSAEI